MAANWLNPSDPGFQDQMPGDMRAVDANEETVLLVSMGMMAVELQTPSGDPLQISEPATLTIPVPADLVADAPATIPLWYFDEDMGTWIEEGQATLQGNEYVGVVNHFTFWNCDVPYPLIQLDGQVLFNDKPLEGYTVTIEIVSSPGETAGTLTDSEGFFGGLVPADELLIISVLNVCGEVLYTEEIGPFSSDVVLDPINITGSVGFFFAEVTGTLVDCDNAPVQNGYVIVDAEGNSIVSATNNGVFNSVFPVCDATEVTVTGLDVDAEKSSDPVTAPISTNIDLGELQACDNDLVPPYYVVNIDTRNFVILNALNSEPITPAIQNNGSQGQNAPTTVLMVDYQFVDSDGNEVLLAFQLEVPTQNVLLDIPQAYISVFYVDPAVTSNEF
ncbi:MAG: astroprincin family protein, partial [Bacteroidota bacterium]